MNFILLHHILIEVRHKSIVKIFKSRFRVRICTELTCYLGLSDFISKLVIIRCNSAITNLSKIVCISDFLTKESKVLTAFLQTKESIVEGLSKIFSNIIYFFISISVSSIIPLDNVSSSISIKNFYITSLVFHILR